MGAPLVEAKQDSSIQVEDLPKVGMGWRRLRLAEQRLVPVEAARHIAYPDNRRFTTSLLRPNLSLAARLCLCSALRTEVGLLRQPPRRPRYAGRATTGGWHDHCPLHSCSCHHGCQEPLFRLAKQGVSQISGRRVLRHRALCSISISPCSIRRSSKLRGYNRDVRRTALRLILVSNRVAIPTESGAHRAGGLEVVLAPTLKRYEGVWFGWSGNVVPRARVTTKTIEKSKQSYVLTDLAEEDYQEYYGGFANRVLWPILHYRIDLAEFTRRDLTGYLRVNQHFADELAKVILPSDLIWVHDYHFIPLGDELRKRGHTNRIGFFLHVPFPAPEFITVLPRHERFLSSLLQYDLVGFQTEGDVRNFVRYVLSENRGSNIRTLLATDRQMVLSQDGRNTRVGSFPVGIDTGGFERLARRAAQSSFVREVVESSWGANIADRRRSA